MISAAGTKAQNGGGSMTEKGPPVFLNYDQAALGCGSKPNE
jgi:hypothetical protein